MPQADVAVNNEVGLHARPATLFVNLASSFPCEVKIRNVTTGGSPANAKSILGLLTVGAKQGHTISIETTGERADEALKALVELVEGNFRE